MEPYSGCGQVWGIVECGIGLYAEDGQVFFVENLEGFSVGDWACRS